ncbi:MAG: hypothetical protein C4524_05030 [Candidatus Zixiibacteriota bacterium]|nr:MAG: hypothetical protein C4524_05030 [candidate division Zixibacteria bacterium]
MPYIDGMKIALILLLLPLGASAGGPNHLLDRLPDEVPPGFSPGEMGPHMLILDGATNSGTTTYSQTLSLHPGWNLVSWNLDIPDPNPLEPPFHLEMDEILPGPHPVGGIRDTGFGIGPRARGIAPFLISSASLP